MANITSVSKRTVAEAQRKLKNDANFTKQVRASLTNSFVKVYEKFLQDFNSHPVTKEIEAGPNSSNISGTLGGTGNLFTYIGFSSGSKPIEPLRKTLEEYSVRFNYQNNKVSILIEVPTKEMLFQVTPLPWATGRSWAKSIETGLSGLGQYLYTNSPRSRSGGAVQVKSRLRVGKFNNTPYLSSLLNEYYKEIKKIERMTL
jgi:hypothetical protein